NALHFEQALVLLDERVFRLGEDALERRLVEVLERRDHREATNELGDQPVFEQILRFDFAEDLASAAILRRDHPGTEADRSRAAACRDDLLQSAEGTAAYEQNVSSIDLQEFLLRMLAAALRGHRGDGALHDLQQRLLHALARHIAGDRG